MTRRATTPARISTGFSERVGPSRHQPRAPVSAPAPTSRARGGMPAKHNAKPAAPRTAICRVLSAVRPKVHNACATTVMMTGLMPCRTPAKRPAV